MDNNERALLHVALVCDLAEFFLDEKDINMEEFREGLEIVGIDFDELMAMSPLKAMQVVCKQFGEMVLDE